MATKTLRSDYAPVEESRLNKAGKIVRSLIKNPSGLFGIIVVILITIAAIGAPLIAPHDPYGQNIPARLSSPGVANTGETYTLGTDSLGRDIASRIIYGARITILIGLSAVGLAGLIGVMFGLLAGFYRGWIDSILMRLVDIWMSIPFLILAIAVVAVLGPSLFNLVLVLALTGWVTFGRVVRGQVLAIREGGYVESARAAGAGNFRIMLRHILPNISTSIIVIGTLQIALMVTMEAALSFLGLGVQPPTPTWGSMVAEGKDVVAIAWWLSTFPGLAIVITVLGINLLGDWLRDTLDPRLRV